MYEERYAIFDDGHLAGIYIECYAWVFCNVTTYWYHCVQEQDEGGARSFDSGGAKVVSCQEIDEAYLFPCPPLHMSCHNNFEISYV